MDREATTHTAVTNTRVGLTCTARWQWEGGLAERERLSLAVEHLRDDVAHQRLGVLEVTDVTHQVTVDTLQNGTSRIKNRTYAVVEDAVRCYPKSISSSHKTNIIQLVICYR